MFEKISYHVNKANSIIYFLNLHTLGFRVSKDFKDFWKLQYTLAEYHPKHLLQTQKNKLMSEQVSFKSSSYVCLNSYFSVCRYLFVPHGIIDSKLQLELFSGQKYSLGCVRDNPGDKKITLAYKYHIPNDTPYYICSSSFERIICFCWSRGLTVKQ